MSQHRLDNTLVKQTNSSRKQIRMAISEGRVTVNGDLVYDCTLRLTEFCHVTLDGQTIGEEKKAYYVMMNKPKDVVSATSDADNKCCTSCIDTSWSALLHIVGRLDIRTTGLLLLTNDGRWSLSISRPLAKVAKCYRVTTLYEIDEFEQVKGAFKEGLYLPDNDVKLRPAGLERLGDNMYRLTLFEGRRHQGLFLCILLLSFYTQYRYLYTI